MIADLPTLAAKYRSKGILLDSNLLVLLFIGLGDPRLVETARPTRNQGFTAREFSLLREIIGNFSKIITTPHVLTETSNHIFQLHGKQRCSALQIIAKNIQSFKERRAESKNLVRISGFFDFGLTDSALLDIPPKKYLVLSADRELVIALQAKGVDAINFNHLRGYEWQIGN